MRSSMLLVLGAMFLVAVAAPAAMAAPDGAPAEAVPAAGPDVAMPETVAESATAPGGWPGAPAGVAEPMPAAPAETAEPMQAVPAELAEPMPAGPAQAVEPIPAAPAATADPFVAGPTETANSTEGQAPEPGAPSAGAPEVAEVPAAPEGVEVAEPVAPPADPEPESDASPVEPAAKPAPRLGPYGWDSEGRRGRIHIVAVGDTLWDISDAYLGTPWVWPSIWQDNRDIQNPHLVYPGDRIWITPWEMRILTDEEVDALMAARPAAPEAPQVEEPEEIAEPEEVPIVAEVPVEPRVVLARRVSSREMVGLVTVEEYEASASIVDAVPDRHMLAQKDRVYVGLGEGEVELGDQFTIYRSGERVYDPDDGSLLGYHVDILGWLDIVEVHAEASLAEVRQSTSEIELGDRLTVREPIELDVTIQQAPQGVEGKISFFPKSRVLAGQIDFVYLNRGTEDGLEVGSPLEVYRVSRSAKERARHTVVSVPERVVAELLVVRARSASSVAIVTHTAEELELGDSFRGAGQTN